MRCPAKACQGNNVQAEALHLGEDHPETLISLNRSLNNMANALSSQGKLPCPAKAQCPSRGTATMSKPAVLGGAQRHCTAVLGGAEEKKTLGEDHPETLPR
uniref:Uncharacterized protein n=1 Tax=Ditylum brightwellii TaxID=49249 RepID=A0A7S4VYS6_9STRA